MKLMTKEIEKRLPTLGSTDGKDMQEIPIIAKFFTPDSNWTWYVTEGQKGEKGDFLFFGLVIGFEKELGYFTLSQLQEVKGPLGLSVERDRHFGTHTLDEFYW